MSYKSSQIPARKSPWKMKAPLSRRLQKLACKTVKKTPARCPRPAAAQLIPVSRPSAGCFCWKVTGFTSELKKRPLRSMLLFNKGEFKGEFILKLNFDLATVRLCQVSHTLDAPSCAIFSYLYNHTADRHQIYEQARYAFWLF